MREVVERVQARHERIRMGNGKEVCTKCGSCIVLRLGIPPIPSQHMHVAIFWGVRGTVSEVTAEEYRSFQLPGEGRTEEVWERERTT